MSSGGARSKARKRALDLLFAADLRRESATETLDRSIAEGSAPTNPYTETLVRGVVEHLTRIDEVLTTYAQGWTLKRMPAIDRALLRMGAYELSHTDVPVGVCISEAVELAKRYSTDDSHRFINGMLASVASEIRPDQTD
jgi:N utilization substance protein B